MLILRMRRATPQRRLFFSASCLACWVWDSVLLWCCSPAPRAILPTLSSRVHPTYRWERRQPFLAPSVCSVASVWLGGAGFQLPSARRGYLSRQLLVCSPCLGPAARTLTSWLIFLGS